ncbi:tyrosine-type recombinase/integrase [Sphingomonas montanisoli]|uniref:tyrosine-type recombinase/integrase n=1 Tax=Sphingomonas montanisoli TaxID=2606412 RepID=UPI001FE7D0CB|nr:site-specific integrase [Sphingomonas montanisoli]
MAYYIEQKAEIRSIERARQAWRQAGPFWSAIPIGRVDKMMARDYRDHRSHCKAVTVRNELAIVRAALNLCEEDKLIAKAPFVQMPSLPQNGVKHLTKDQFRKLIAGTEKGAPHIALFMQLAIATGARMAAILELKWDQVKLDSGRIFLNPEDRIATSKGRATVPINDQLRPALEAAKVAATSDYVIEHNGKRVGSIKTAWNAAARRSGVKATPHMLRHSAAVWMAEAGQSMDVIAQFLGHTDSRITQRVYARFSPDFLRGAAEALTY